MTPLAPLAPLAPRAVLAQRLAAQLLAGPRAGTAEAVAERLLAVQAQDPRGARLAIRARSRGLTAADVDAALSVNRSLMIGWLNRGTLHLVRTEDYWWLRALTTPRLMTGNARRLAQEGVPPGDADRAVTVVARSLAGGPLTRAELGERIAAAGVRTQGQALIHLLALAYLRGVAVRGPVRGHEQAYVLARDWLGPPPPVDRERALAELARRYLAGHGPACDRDLAQWAGLPVGDARRGLRAIAGDLAWRPDGLATLAGRTAGDPPRRLPPRRLPPPRLLGAFEPLLLGWSSREPVLGGHGPRIIAGGMFRPFLLAGGRAAGTWTLTAQKVSVTPFAPLSAPAERALAAEAADVERFLAGRAARRGRSG